MKEITPLNPNVTPEPLPEQPPQPTIVPADGAQPAPVVAAVSAAAPAQQPGQQITPANAAAPNFTAAQQMPGAAQPVSSVAPSAFQRALDRPLLLTIFGFLGLIMTVLSGLNSLINFDIISAFISGLIAFLYWKLLKGSNTARIIFCVLLVLGIIGAGIALMMINDAANKLGAAGLAVIVGVAAAFTLVYQIALLVYLNLPNVKRYFGA